MKTSILVAVAAVALAGAAPARAGELFGGLFVHGVDTPLTLGGSPEGGVDLQLGYRAAPLGGLKLEPYLFASVNSRGDTHFAAVGLSRKFGDRWYIRPGLGLAIHTGSSKRFDNESNDRIEFGSRLLFEPELAIGARLNPRMTVEASWVHLSHATLFSGQNPGLDTIGMRLNYRF